MALKAGLVGVNPDILDNSDRVTALSDGNKKLTFVYDEASDQPGFKINDGDFHPFEKAGVTCMGWVKPADLSVDDLTPNENVEIASGGIFIKGNDVFVDMVLKNKGNSNIPINTTLVSGFPTTAGGNRYILFRSMSHNSLESAINNDVYAIAISDNTQTCVSLTGANLSMNTIISTGYPYVRIFGKYIKA